MKPMLTRPHRGWTEFRLAGRVYALSYLTAIPVEWLDRAIFGLESGQAFTVRAMLEPGELRCTVSSAGSRIVTGDGAEWTDVGTVEFCRQLHAALTACPEDWAAFAGTDLGDLGRKLRRLERLLK